MKGPYKLMCKDDEIVGTRYQKFASAWDERVEPKKRAPYGAVGDRRWAAWGKPTVSLLAPWETHWGQVSLPKPASQPLSSPMQREQPLPK